MYQRTLANRVTHSFIISALVIGSLIVLYEPLGTIMAGVIALFPIVGWALGRLHQRAIVIESGIITESDLKDIERDLQEELSPFRTSRILD